MIGERSFAQDLQEARFPHQLSVQDQDGDERRDNEQAGSASLQQSVIILGVVHNKRMQRAGVHVVVDLSVSKCNFSFVS